MSLLKNLTIKLLLLLSGLLFSGVSFSQTNSYIPVTNHLNNSSATNFDKHFIYLLRRWRLPGAAVAIMQHNNLVLSRGYGWADVENRQPVQPDSLFRIASVSKAITATAILQLVQEQKIKLDDSAFTILHLNPLENLKPKPGIYQISIRNLLQMSSGWYSGGPRDYDIMFGPWSGRMARLMDYKVPPDCLTATRTMMSIPSQFHPGTHYSYSNLNYCMLGLIINKVTGMEGQGGYEAYIKQHLLEPLGITDMRIGETSWQNRAPLEVKYYNYGFGANHLLNIDGLPYSQSDILKKNYADGGWIASAVSLVKLLHALGHYQILTPDMIRIMTAKPNFQKKDSRYFAMGWTVRYAHGHRYYLKTGSFTGTTALVVQRDDGTSYAALFNSKPAEKQRFMNELERILLSFG